MSRSGPLMGGLRCHGRGFAGVTVWSVDGRF